MAVGWAYNGSVAWATCEAVRKDRETRDLFFTLNSCHSERRLAWPVLFILPPLTARSVFPRRRADFLRLPGGVKKTSSPASARPPVLR